MLPNFVIKIVYFLNKYLLEKFILHFMAKVERRLNWKSFSKTSSLFDDIIIRQKVSSPTKSWSSLNFCLCIFILPWMEFPWFIASYPIIVQYSCCIWINIATFLFPFDLERGSWISSLIVWMFIGIEVLVTKHSAY